MSSQEPPALQLKPIISYPREAQVGKTYLVSIDVQLTTPNTSWDYPEEEYTIGFILNTSPYFTCEPLHDVWPTIILHRYGGTYGPAEFLLTAAEYEIERGQISITLVNGWGIPMARVELPCEVNLGGDIHQQREITLSPSRNAVIKQDNEYHNVAGMNVEESYTDRLGNDIGLPPKIKVLVIVINDYYQQQLDLNAYGRAIHPKLHDNILFIAHYASTISDIRRALLNDNFQIVQIVAQHQDKELVLEDETGRRNYVSPQTLVELFKIYRATLQCVILNAYSAQELGKHIVSVIPFTITMTNKPGDNVSIEFLRGFYDALNAGKEIESAYQRACLFADFTSINEWLLPKLFKHLQEKQEPTDQIAAMLTEAGWIVVDIMGAVAPTNPYTAIRIYPYGGGIEHHNGDLEYHDIDFLLLVNGEAVGSIIKEETEVFSSVVDLVDGLINRSKNPFLSSLTRSVREPLPFLYVMQGEEIRFTNNLEPEARTRTVFYFHRPETFALWLNQAPVGTPNDLNNLLRSRLRRMPPLSAVDRLASEIQAITNLEISLAQNRPRALVQIANSTQMIIHSMYRLLLSGSAKRILCIVDSWEDTKKTVSAFYQYVTPHNYQYFTDIFSVSHNNQQNIFSRDAFPDPSSNVCILNIEYVYRLLSNININIYVEENDFNHTSQTGKSLRYLPELSIEFFDVIFFVECFDRLHSYYRLLLDYFDAFLVGVGGDIPLQVISLFKRNLIYQDQLPNASILVQKIWKYFHFLNYERLSYGDYIEQLTYLLYLKIADERTKPPFDEPSGLSTGYDWQSLLERSGSELKAHYSDILNQLGKKKGMPSVIFKKAGNKIQNPATLHHLIVDLIESQNWSGLAPDILGDMYEGLLEKNVEDNKSGAGQYFTPRQLIGAIVDVMHPEPGMRIYDPASGTGGFLLAAQEYIINHNQLTRQQASILKNETFYGKEIIGSVARLGSMNLLLHGIRNNGEYKPPITIGDSLWKSLNEQFDIVLSNPPFERKASPESPERADFWAKTSNKQLNFVQHTVSLLKLYGKAAIVIPDNVLFLGGAGEKIRSNLLKQCDVHTLLRLPANIFYNTGISANVLFFDRMPGRDKPWTKELWIYDLRTNYKFNLRTKPLKREHLEDFVRCYNPENRHDRKETARFRKFAYDELIKRDKLNLDIFWQSDENLDSNEK